MSHHQSSSTRHRRSKDRNTAERGSSTSSASTSSSSSSSSSSNKRRGSGRKKLSASSSSSSSTSSPPTRRQKVVRQVTRASSNDELPLAFSGWIHVATSSRSSGKKKFKKRYCKLRDVLVTFYDNVGDKAVDSDKHMIVRVGKLAEVNQGISLVNHKGKFVSLYTENENDFDMWYTAFDTAFKAAQRSKEVRQRSVMNLPTPKSMANMSPKEKLRKLKLSDSYQVLPGAADKAAASCVSKSGWLMKEFSTALLVKKTRRRFFTLDGKNLSYFDLNMEGREAEGTGVVKSVSLASNGKMLSVVLHNGKTIRMEAKNSDEKDSWHSVLRKAAALA